MRRQPGAATLLVIALVVLPIVIVVLAEVEEIKGRLKSLFSDMRAESRGFSIESGAFSQRAPPPRDIPQQSRALPTSPPPSSLDAPESLPQFPWPPPVPSALVNLDERALVNPNAPQPSLLEVGQRLTAALRRAGYVEYGFHRAPGGFALVTRLERITDQGQPFGGTLRYAHSSANEPFRLDSYLRALFFATPGYYRVIVFVISDRPFVASGPRIGPSEADALRRDGTNLLPRSMKDQPFSAAHAATALIYEYRRSSDQAQPIVLIPSRLPAMIHLTGAGLHPLVRSPP